MPGFVVTFANVVICSHAGKANPVPPAGRVTIMGFGAVTLAHSYLIAGCTFPALTLGVQPPCVAGQFTSGAARVMSMGFPLAVLPSLSVCPPNPTPLIPAPLPPLLARVYAM